MKYANIKYHDIANGPGVRVSLFVSGCNHHCKGCFNKDAWDFNYGYDFDDETISNILNQIDKPYISGLTILGGEPMDVSNQETVLDLILKVKEKSNKSIWVYSGYTYDELLDRDNMTTNQIISLIDVLVDGRFVQELYSPNLNFRGSSNQRIIDIQKTINGKNIILHEKNN